MKVKISLVIIAMLAIITACKKTVHPSEQYSEKVKNHISILTFHSWRYNSIIYRKNGTNEYMTPPLPDCYKGIRIKFYPRDGGLAMTYYAGTVRCLTSQLDSTRAGYNVGGYDYKNPASADSLWITDKPDFSRIWTSDNDINWFKIEAINLNELYISRVTGDSTIYERYIPF